MTTRPDVLRLWAAFALLGAGLVHLAVTSEHVAESVWHGVFFAVTGGVQLCWALALMARTRIPAPRALVALQVGLVTLWVLSRTAGLPVPPAAWRPEPVGTADLLAVALELLAVAATVTALASAPTGPTAPLPAGRTSRRLLAGAGAGALLVAALTTPALAATEAGEHAHPHGEHHAAG